MGVLNHVKKIAGSALDIDIELPHRYLIAQTSVRFYVTLNSEEPIRVRRVVASLAPADITRSPLDWKDDAVAEEVVSGALSLEANVPVHISGTIEIPTPEGEQVEEEQQWELRVMADVPNGVDSAASVEFTVAPACQLEWQTDEPILLKIPGEYTEVMARGTCTVVRVTGTPVETLSAVIGPVVARALADLLNDDTRLIRRQQDARIQREIAGALRELVNPRIRHSDALPIDSVATLTLDEFRVTRH